MYKVTFYLGIERDGTGAQVPAEVRAAGTAAVRRLLAETLGGYTLMHGAGGWVNDAGELVEEGMLQLECYMSTERALPSRADVDALARTIGAVLRQSQVLIEWTRVDARMVNTEVEA